MSDILDFDNSESSSDIAFLNKISGQSENLLLPQKTECIEEESSDIEDLHAFHNAASRRPSSNSCEEDISISLSSNRSVASIINEPIFYKKSIRDKYFELASYQQEGVDWLFKRVQAGSGGILADDMGLGKTVQTAFFLSLLFNLKAIKNVLLVIPPSLTSNWKMELQKWCPGIEVYHHENRKAKQLRAMMSKNSSGRIVITSYGQFSGSNPAPLINPMASDQTLPAMKQLVDNFKDKDMDLKEFQKRVTSFRWDVVILDEAQNSKTNASNTARMLRLVDASHRFALTGTPLENNLQELWTLIDFVSFGRALGDQESFKAHYENPIIRGKVKDASAVELKDMQLALESLHAAIDPFILRRLKTDARVKQHISGERYEFVLWIQPTPQQASLYNEYLGTKFIKESIADYNSNKQFTFPLITALQKICIDPSKLSTDKELANLPAAAALKNLSWQERLNYSAKYKSLIYLLNSFMGIDIESVPYASRRNLASKHKALIFSQHTTTLDLIEEPLRALGLNFLRLDGNVKTEERGGITQKFNDDPRSFLLIMSIGAGGVGLNLVAASRVIIFEPTWNPNKENQASDRAYRFGNKGNVITYRFILSNTIEEFFFRRQVFKTTLYKAAVDDFNITRYFKKDDILKLFSPYQDYHETFKQMYDPLLLSSLEKSNNLTPEELKHLTTIITGSAPNIIGASLLADVVNKKDETDIDFELAKEDMAISALDSKQALLMKAKRAQSLLPADDAFVHALTGQEAPRIEFPPELSPYRSNVKQMALIKIIAQGTNRHLIDAVKKLPATSPYKQSLIKLATQMNNRRIDLILGINRSLPIEDSDPIDPEALSEIDYDYFG